MIDSTFSRATWLNSLHMSTSHSRCWRREGFARGNCSKAVTSPRRPARPAAPESALAQQVFANACRLSDEPALGLRLGLRAVSATACSATRCSPRRPSAGRCASASAIRSCSAPTSTCRWKSPATAPGWWPPATARTRALRPFNTELCLGSLKVTCADLLGQPLPCWKRPSTMPATRAMARAYAEGSPAVALRTRAQRHQLRRRMAGAPVAASRPGDHREVLDQCRRQNINTGRASCLAGQRSGRSSPSACRTRRPGGTGQAPELFVARPAPAPSASS